MAEGDVLTFEEFTLNIGNGTHDLDTHSFKVALLTNAVVPTAADTTPALGDYTECTAGGNYTAGGQALTVTYTEAAGVSTFQITANSSWTKQAGSPTNAYYGLVYNDTNAGKEAICFVDLGGPVDMTAVDLVINWGASTFTVTRSS